MSLQSSIKNAALTAGGVLFHATNAPAQYQSRQRQYHADETTRFTEKYAQYASDYVKGQAQGLDSDNMMAWQTIYLRFSDIGRATATTTKKSDDYKRVQIANRSVDYLPPGAKIVTMGSTWLAINPNNISGVGAGGIVQRCNAVWNYLDWYGNVRSEPIAVDRALARANNTDTQEAMNLTKGYFDVKAQLNGATAQLAENSRMILGRNCYRITGFSDFTQEFTGDYSSVRMIEFSIHFEEPNAEIDDMENHVAGGKTFVWEIAISGTPNMAAGDKAAFTASSQRMNVPVINTAEKPITYLWSSSDESVATVDTEGNVTAISDGECVITAVLEQNPAMTAQMAVAVVPAEHGGAVKFLQTPTEKLMYGESTSLEAAYFYDGEKTGEEITWTISGASQEAYTAENEWNRITVRCWGGSAEPLLVTAACNGMTATASIELWGI